MRSKRSKQTARNIRAFGIALLVLLPLMMAAATSTAAIAAIAAGPPQNEGATVLAAGDPPLTQAMVDQRIVVWEVFFEVKINREQHDLLQRLLVEAWKQGDQEDIHGTVEDVKLYGKESDIVALRATNRSAYVDSLRKQPNDALARLILEIYDAAHPERKDFMRAHGMGDLVGEWKRIDYLSPTTAPYSHEVIGISFTDSLILDFYSDGHFKHFWVHSHCDSGYRCCRKYGTDVSGTVFVEGGKLVLKAESGTQLSDVPCNPAANSFGHIQPHEESFALSIKRRANNGLALCLAAQPFDPWQQGPGKTMCYEKQ